jgi:rhodanese-related sulfurtransferase
VRLSPDIGDEFIRSGLGIKEGTEPQDKRDCLVPKKCAAFWACAARDEWPQNSVSKSQGRITASEPSPLFSNQKETMKTIDPLKLEALLETSQPIEILDIRPLAEFEKVHIEGAHSMPSAEICAETLISTRQLLMTEPLYLVSQSGTLAQLQARALERQGLDNLFVVGGGMQGWQSSCLPVVRRRPVADWLSDQCARICSSWQAGDPSRSSINYGI